MDRVAVSPAQPVREHHQQRMSGEAWVLFAAMSLIWGLPYLFIKVAVAEVDPATLVFARTTLALIILLLKQWSEARLSRLKSNADEE